MHLAPELLDAIVAHARSRTRARAKAYFFFDEIQNVPHWEKWLHKALTGANDCVFVLTGSNATMLSGELATTVTGRYRSYELFPFGLSEVRALRGKTPFEEYLRLGGFPVAVTDADPQGYLKELFRNIVLRDIASRVGARSPLGLMQTVTAVYQSVGSELSLRRLAGSVGLAVDTAGHYLAAAEQAYLLFACPYFSHSERQSARRNKKYYAVDTALRQSVSGTAGRDHGKNLENLVYLTLRRRGVPVSYWRDQGEVDFVAKIDERVVPIQVSWEGIAERHERALERFYERFPHAEEAVVVDAENAEEFVETGGAEVVGAA